MNKVYKTILGVTAALVVAGASIVPANVIAWGDSNNGRTTYTLEQINAGKLGKTITFNSITNGKIGDERNFVGAKLSSSTANKWNADTIAVKDGETYTIRLYVHNNSPYGMDAIATGVSASISLPTTVSKSHTVIGYLNAENANPTRYWDEVTFTSDDNFYLEFVSGSAKYTNTQGVFRLDDSVITSGAKLGYTSMNGQIPGCYDYDGQVTIEVKVHNSVPNRISKTVRIKNSGEKFDEHVDAKVGDEVEFQIEYKNLSDQTVNNVMIRDILPDNLEYVQDSTYVYNSSHKEGVRIIENTVTTTGINIGSYKPRGNAYVRFTAKVVNKNLACGSNQLVNWSNATVGYDVVKDDASVMVSITCEPKKEPETKSSIAKTVRIKGSDKDFAESINAKIGDEVEFQIVYTNLSDKKVDNVVIVDSLPSNLEYVKGSTYLYNSKNTKGTKVSENTLTTNGINIGSYESKEGATIRFTAKVVEGSLSCGDNKLVNWASATVDKKVVKDDASVKVNRTCKPTPVDPEPTPEPEPDPEPIPEPVVIVDTGPTSVLGAALGAGSIVTAAGYFVLSRKRA